MLPSTITSFLSTAAAPGLSSHLGALFSQDRFARELDAIALNRQHFHQDLIALVQFVANIFDAMFGDLADVQQPVRSGEDFDERAEIRESNDFAKICLTNLRRRRNVADDLQRLAHCGLIAGGNIHPAGIFDVDLDAGLLNDSTNHLPAGTDEVANLVDRDLQRMNARSKFGNRTT